MSARRDFLKKAALLAGAAGVAGKLPASIQKAFAINPDAGSNWYDAEHIVLLMQENRSFDHCFGTLQGVRGFNDPRAITLPDRNKVWLQSNHKGETYAPFRLDIKDTKATWMSSLPHSWADQLEARNDGKYDKWLQAKKGGYPDIPMTMGYYNRKDLPFYYAMADAFTVCDQHFCSSLTGTTPNRLFFWTGNIREDDSAKARLYNSETYYDAEAAWKTFPERLQENDISWKVYQNEIGATCGFSSEEYVWLSNFEDNPLEWFTQYNVKLSKGYLNYLQIAEAFHDAEKKELAKKLTELKDDERKNVEEQIADIDKKIKAVIEDKKIYTQEAYNKLTPFQKEIHERAFTTNIADPDYHKLAHIKYEYHNETQKMAVPKGDILKQFRDDVQNGKLPEVSWLVAPENYCDHPSAPWYGAWYISEVMDILTQNPEVWKKTIFIITYDENDGSFDHVPPFIPPHPLKKSTGLVTDGIDTTIDYADNAFSKQYDVEGPIGLGYRVPMIIASPWSRGGFVCSEIFDHTSSLQFLEKFVEKKHNKKIKQENISSWRRAVCGDLVSAFRLFNGEVLTVPSVPDQEGFLEDINKAMFKDLPDNYKKLTKNEIAQINLDPASSPYMPQQEKGIRPSCALPYELYVDGQLDASAQNFAINMRCGNTVFGNKSAGSAFQVYAPEKYTDANKTEAARSWAYAAEAGKTLQGKWPLKGFKNKGYHLCVYGPNGFFRRFKGKAGDPQLDIMMTYGFNGNKLTGNVAVHIKNTGNKPVNIAITDNAYQSPQVNKQLQPTTEETVVLDLSSSHSWYDFSVTIHGNNSFERSYAGHVETGESSYTDPLMGQIFADDKKASSVMN